MFKNDISGYEIPVSSKSAHTVVVALVAARNAGVISDSEYCMTYAEICEPGRYPQAFGGGAMNPERMARWQTAKSWVDFD